MFCVNESRLNTGCGSRVCVNEASVLTMDECPPLSGTKLLRLSERDDNRLLRLAEVYLGLRHILGEILMELLVPGPRGAPIGIEQGIQVDRVFALRRLTSRLEAKEEL